MLWPNNKRLALMLSFDIDAETLWLTRNEINKNHPANLSRGLYSVKQGRRKPACHLFYHGLHGGASPRSY